MLSKKPSGSIIYRGPSLINGSPIVVVAITKSTNPKTGDMVQTYILADNGKSPVQSARDLDDVAICGDCPHRRGMGGSCYVNLGQGARAVLDGVVRGIYPVLEASTVALLITGRMVRLGTYGDPAAVPVAVWAQLVAQAKGWTGYTHQWRNALGLAVREFCMASADTPAERDLARSLGFRTFRVRTSDQTTMPGEFMCPAAAESGKRTTCADCGACGGGQASRKADPVIVVHGSLAKRFAATVSA
jgi:hypothetical protein